MDVAITGASGLIGTALRQHLSGNGHRPISLVRRAADGADEITWDPATGTLDAASLEGVDAVVNLAGAGIGDRRWTEAYKRLIVDSRLTSTTLIAQTLAQLDRPPQVLLSSSAIGYYGAQADNPCSEDAPPGNDFLAQLCVDWERAADSATEAGIRTVHMRTGLVMSATGGVLPRLVTMFKFGAGGRLGSGSQYMSWITIDDMVDAIMHAASGSLAGAVNFTAPNPVTNAEFTKVLAKVLSRPAILPVPAFGPRLLLGAERANSLLFASQNVLPDVLVESGYQFGSSDLESGLRTVLDRDPITAGGASQ